MSKAKLTILTICIITLLILNISSLTLLTRLERSYEDLREDYARILEKHNLLKQALEALESEYEDLKTKHLSLEEEYLILRENYSQLASENAKLRNALDNLYRRVDILERNLSAFSDQYIKLLADYTALNSSYSSLRGDYERLEDLLDRISARVLIEPETTPNLIKIALGESSELRKELIEDIGVSKLDTPAVKAEKILTWILRNLEYIPDDFHEIVLNHSITSIQDYASSPTQTLIRSGGDCEDLSILVYVLFQESRSSSEAVYLIALEGASLYAHMAVLYKSDEGFMIVDPAGLYLTDRQYAMRVTFERGDILRRESVTAYLNPLMISPRLKSRLFEEGLAELVSNPGSLVRPSPISETITKWVQRWSRDVPGAYVSFIANSTFYKKFNSTEDFIGFVESGGLG